MKLLIYHILPNSILHYLCKKIVFNPKQLPLLLAKVGTFKEVEDIGLSRNDEGYYLMIATKESLKLHHVCMKQVPEDTINIRTMIFFSKIGKGLVADMLTSNL